MVAVEVVVRMVMLPVAAVVPVDILELVVVEMMDLLALQPMDLVAVVVEAEVSTAPATINLQ